MLMSGALPAASHSTRKRLVLPSDQVNKASRREPFGIGAPRVMLPSLTHVMASPSPPSTTWSPTPRGAFGSSDVQRTYNHSRDFLVTGQRLEPLTATSPPTLAQLSGGGTRERPSASVSCGVGARGSGVFNAATS